MMDQRNGHRGGGQEETPRPEGEGPGKVDSIAEMIRLRVAQCGPLLRQQLERKARQQPTLYGQARVQQIIRQFEASMADVQAVIASRVMTRITEHVHTEVLRLLEDALSDGVDIDENSVGKPPQDVLSASAGPPAQVRDSSPDRGRPALGGPSGPSGGGEGSGGGGGPHRTPPSPRPQEPPAAARGQGREGGGPAASPPSKEPGQPGARPKETGGLSGTTGLGDPPDRRPALGRASEVYEGTVKLRVGSADSVGQVVHFVDALRRKSDFRLLQMVGTPKDGVGIWVGLRAPLPLRDVLLMMEGVSRVEVVPGLSEEEPLLDVYLVQAAAG